jgi:hypothetical protein
VTPNPTPTRAKSCPLCDGDADFLNVIPVYTWERFKTHAADRHPGIEAKTLWAFPAPWKAARG